MKMSKRNLKRRIAAYLVIAAMLVNLFQGTTFVANAAIGGDTLVTKGDFENPTTTDAVEVAAGSGASGVFGTGVNVSGGTSGTHGSVMVEYATDEGYDGTGALKISRKNGETLTANKNVLANVPTTTMKASNSAYKVSVKLKAVGVTNGNFKVYFKYQVLYPNGYNGYKTTGKETIFIEEDITADQIAEWTEFSVLISKTEIQAMKNDFTANVDIQGLETGYVLIDDLTVEPVAAYELNFDTNEGSFVHPVVQATSAITPIDLNAYVPERDGYRFDGWYSDEELTTAITEALTLTEDTTIYAKWTEELYTAGVVRANGQEKLVKKGDKVSITIKVGHTTKDIETEHFNADEVVINYPAAKLTYESISPNATVEVGDGTLKIVNYGDDRDFGEVYTLVFAVADDAEAGTARVSLTSAAFVDKEGASEGDLESIGTPSPANADFTVGYTVVLPDDLDVELVGSSVVESGKDYTFSVTDENYNYTFSATVGGAPVNVTDNGDGTYTVAADALTGDLTITGTATPKTFDVSAEGSAAGDVVANLGADKAAYKTDFTFTINKDSSYTYDNAPVVTIGGDTYGSLNYDDETGVYTIAGADITGDIVITINKALAEVTVDVEGNGSTDLTGFDPEAKVEIGTDYTLTLDPKAGYAYTVTATMGGEDVELIVAGNAYTVENVTGDLVFNIARAIDKDCVEVRNMIEVEGRIVYAVVFNTELTGGDVPTYNGEKMYWSEIHDDYIYLVISGETLSAETAKADVASVAGSVENTVTAGFDINDSGDVDASDAQYVWNMYNGYYTEFADEVAMDDFIQADLNADYSIDVLDATAIVNEVVAAFNSQN